MTEDTLLEQLKKAIIAQNNDRINNLIAQIEIDALDTLFNKPKKLLHWAAQHGTEETIKKLLDTNLILVYKTV